MSCPGSDPLPGASASFLANDKSPLVFTIDAIDMQGVCTQSLLTSTNRPAGYYLMKEFQVLNAPVNVALLPQGLVGCTPVQPQLAVATNAYAFYTVACGAHPSFSIEAFTRSLCLVHKVSDPLS